MIDRAIKTFSLLFVANIINGKLKIKFENKIMNKNSMNSIEKICSLFLSHLRSLMTAIYIWSNLNAPFNRSWIKFEQKWNQNISFAVLFAIAIVLSNCQCNKKRCLTRKRIQCWQKKKNKIKFALFSALQTLIWTLCWCLFIDYWLQYFLCAFFIFLSPLLW